MRVSAAIIAYNEEKNIRNAIESVRWADEILVVDSGSSDRTREIAGEMGARVITREWPGFARQKQFAVENAANDLIFSLDADEVASPELVEEIKALVTDGSHADGYRIPRLAFYMGRPIYHSGWYPDRQLRLFDRRKGAWKDLLVHESVAMRKGAAVIELNGHILHYSVDDAAHHHRMIGERYAPLAARQAFDDGKRTNAFRVAVAGPAAFLRSYVLKAGFLDGFPGFCIAKFAAHHAFLKTLMLHELQQGPDQETPA